MITKDTAVELGNTGKTLYHKKMRNADGTPVRCRVNGRCKTWKTRPEEFRLPVKHGLKTCFYITDCSGAHEWTTSEEEAKGAAVLGAMQGKGAA